MIRRVKALHLIGIVAAVAIAGCAAQKRTRPNVLLVTVDTLRADRLGCYGCLTALTPNIDALASAGILFTEAYAPVPRTSQSVASILTGLSPAEHGVRGHGEILQESVETYPEIFARSGYRVAAVVTNYVLSGKGYQQGFDPFLHMTKRSIRESNADEVTEAAIEQLRDLADASSGENAPFFLWVHYVDPHWTYDPPAPYAERFIGRPLSEVGNPFRSYYKGKTTKGEILFRNDMSEEMRAVAGDLYDAEIAATDHNLGPLFDEVRELGLEDETIVAFTSDHGESMGENDYYYGHGEYLYDVTLRVPMIVRFPGGSSAARGRIDDRLFRLYDLLPTVADAAGVAHNRGSGRSRLAAVLGRRGGDRPEMIYSESDFRLTREENPRRVTSFEKRWRCARDDRWKLIRIPGDGDVAYELYDKVNDPGETEDRYDGKNEEVKRLARFIDEWEEAHPGGPGVTGQDTLSSQDVRHLKALGYIH